MPIIIHHKDYPLNVIQKRSGTNSTFSTQTNHTSAFNTVHIIAAVIGVIGALIVTVTIFLYCKKRKKLSVNKALDATTNYNTDTITMITNNRQFGQFASDFNSHIEQPPKTTTAAVVSHVEDISPMMQQYQLQLKLLHQENASSSSSNTIITPPPPPYQP